MPDAPDPGQAVQSLPAWARPEAFLEHQRPESHGWVSAKGTATPCESLQALREAVTKEAPLYVWTPDSPRFLVPEEVPALWPDARRRRLRNSLADRKNAWQRLFWGGLVLAAIALWRRSHSVVPPHQDTLVGIGLLLLFILAFLPWYEAHKTARLARREGEDIRLTEVAEARFEDWLGRQRILATFFLLALIILTYAVQFLGDSKVLAAALVKPSYQSGEWWRLFTAPFLHGNILHLLMNASALLYLGRRTEVLARWPHLLIVFLSSMLAGGIFSSWLVPNPSLGASGGLMGLLGFLIAFEILHRKLVPKPARRRLCAAVGIVTVIGLLGYKFIDNAAHLGGLLAGLAYALIAFPPSSSPHRPRSTKTDLLLASIAALLLLLSAITACHLLLFSP